MDDAGFLSDDERDTVLPDRELDRLRDIHGKAGYREGINDGQESMLQTGFDHGFSESSWMYRQSSMLRGCVSAMTVFFSSKVSKNDALLQDLRNFNDKLKKIEAKQPEIDEIKVKDRKESKEEAIVKSNKGEMPNCEDIEMLIDNLSFGDNSGTSSTECSAEKSNQFCGSPNGCCSGEICVDVKCPNENQISSKNQGGETVTWKNQERVRLKYHFEQESEVEELANLLRQHGISESFVNNLKESFLPER